MRRETEFTSSRSPYIENELMNWKLGRGGEGFESPPPLPVSLLCVHSSRTPFELVNWRTGEGGKIGLPAGAERWQDADRIPEEGRLAEVRGRRTEQKPIAPSRRRGALRLPLTVGRGF